VCLATLGTPAWMRFYHEIVFGACVLGLACCWLQHPPTHPSVGQYLLNMPIIPSLPTQMHAAGLQAGFTLSLIHGLSVPSGIDNRLKIGEISLKSTDKEDQIQISIINDLSLIIDANRSIYRKFG